MERKILNDARTKWNKVYEKEPEQLPWFGIDLPPEVERYLSGLDPDDLILVTGCGLGDVAKTLATKGFTQVLGTDISEVAIKKAKVRFPSLAFQTIATEEIPTLKKLRDVNVLDWLNLHQSSVIAGYIHALGKVAKNLCVVWIYDSSKDVFAKSYVHGGNIYYHKPTQVEKLLKEDGLVLGKQFNFKFTTNLQAGVVRRHNAVGQIYGKK